MCGNELDAWRNIVKVKENFLGSFRSQSYEDIISCMIDSFHRQGVKMSLKIHFLDSHVKFFPSDLGKFSDQHGERFHQTIKNVEDRYRGRCDERMLADFCWLMKI